MPKIRSCIKTGLLIFLSFSWECSNNMDQLQLLSISHSAFPSGIPIDSNADGHIDGLDLTTDGIIDLKFVSPIGIPATGIDINNDSIADFYMYTTSAGSFFNTKSDGTGQPVTAIFSGGILVGYDTNANGSPDIYVSSGSSIVNYIVGGTASGITSPMILSLTINKNSFESITVSANGSFSFASKLNQGYFYEVSIASTSQQCSISNSAGVITSTDINNVTISCGTLGVGGTISPALTGPMVLSLTIDNTVTEILPPLAAGATTFAFTKKLQTNSFYSVLILSAVDTCKISGNTGVMGIVDITNVAITCTQYTIGNSTSPLIGLKNQDAAGTAARFNNQEGIVFLGGFLYVADSGNHTIRQISAIGVVTTMAGVAGSPGSTDGTSSAARFNSPTGITTDGTDLYVTDTGNHTVRRLTTAGVVTTIAGTAGISGNADASGTAAGFFFPAGITFMGANLYVSDKGNDTIRKVTTTGVVTTIAGMAGSQGSTDGTGSAARFNSPTGITTDGTDLYVADTGNHTIRKITIATNMVSTISGSAGVTGAIDGAGVAARFNNPRGITFNGANLFVTDTGNHTIRKIINLGTTIDVSTSAGSAGSAAFVDASGAGSRFNSPVGISTDGTNLYVADTGNHIVRKIINLATTFDASTLAGTAGLTVINNVILSLYVNGVFKETQTLTLASPTLLFNTKLFSGDTYNVMIVSPTQWCRISSNTGVIAASNVTSVTIACAQYTVGGTVTPVTMGPAITLGLEVNTSANLYVEMITVTPTVANVPIPYSFTYKLLNGDFYKVRRVYDTYGGGNACTVTSMNCPGTGCGYIVSADIAIPDVPCP